MTHAEARPTLVAPSEAIAAAQQAQPALVEMTRQLVRTDSQTPPSDTRLAAQIAMGYISDLPGIDISWHPSEPPVMNAVARLSGGLPGPRLVLSGHLDTYPIGDPQRWTVDPLGAELRDGRLYGRGSADMKGGIAALLFVMQAFAGLGRPFPGELVLALAGDEESMGELGTQRLIDTVPEVRGDAVIVADVGSPAIVRCGEKGMIWLDLTAEGRSAHGAHVHRGENAIDALLACLAGLKSLEALQVAVPADVAAVMAAAEYLSEPLGGTGERSVMSRITVNIGRVEGGLSANLVADHAEAQLDIRLPMGTTVATLEHEIERILAGHPRVRHRVTRRYEPTWTDPGHPIVQASLAGASEVLRRPVCANMRVGASDARLWRRAGIPTVVCGLTPHNLGAPDENFDIAELSNLAAIHLLAAARFLGMCA
jgi:succinyl-diaminopimelate desuccinylase